MANRTRRSHAAAPRSSNGASPRPDEALFPQPRSNRTETKETLQGTLEVLRRGKWWLLGAMLLCLVVAGLIAVLHSPRYATQATLMISATQRGGDAPDDATSFGYIDDAPPGERDLYNQELMMRQSLEVMERTAERLQEQRVVPGTDRPLPILERAEAGGPSVAKLLEGQYISINRLGEDVDAIGVTATSPLPAEAALVANTYAEEYVKRTRETSRQRITTSRQFLEQQLTEQGRELRQVENQLESYMSREGTAGLDQEASRTVEQIGTLEAALDEAEIQARVQRAWISELESELKRLRPELEQQVASGVEGEIEGTQEEIANLELQIEQIYARNPQLRDDPSGSEALQRLINRAERFRERLSSLSGQYVEQLMASGGINPRGEGGGGGGQLVELNRRLAEERVALSGTEANIAATEQRLAEYRQKLGTIPEQSMQTAQLQRERQSAEQLYTDLKAKLQEARIAEESEIGLARILRPASVPSMPTWPPSRILVLGLVAGLLLGLGTAFARHKLDTRIRTPEDLREQGFRMLGTTPDLKPIVKNEFDGRDKIDVDGRMVSTGLLALLRPNTAASESFRRLYTNLAFGDREEHVPKTILVTSAEEEAGKTTTAVNLALSAVQMGQRTLLIDADLRRPAVHERLGLASPSTLPKLLKQRRRLQHAGAFAGEGAGARAYATEPHLAEPHVMEDGSDLLGAFATDENGLHVLTSPEPADSPIELLSGRALQHFIERLEEEFDTIIFDSPPTLIATDAALLSRQCDVTVVVAAAGQTDLKALNLAVEELEEVGGYVAGTVLARFNPTQMYGYKYTHGYRLQNYEKYHATAG